MFREGHHVEKNGRSSGKSSWKTHCFSSEFEPKMSLKTKLKQVCYKNCSKNVTCGTVYVRKWIFGQFWGPVAEPKMAQKISRRRQGFSGAFKNESHHSIFSQKRPGQPPGGAREVPRHPQGLPRTPFWDDISSIFTYNFELKSYSDIYFGDSNM